MHIGGGTQGGVYIGRAEAHTHICAPKMACALKSALGRRRRRPLFSSPRGVQSSETAALFTAAMSAPPPAGPAPTGTVTVDAGAIVSPAVFASRAAVAPAASPAAASDTKPAAAAAAAGKPADGAAPVAVEVGHKRNPVTPEMRKMVDEVDMEKGLSSAEAAERAWPNGARRAPTEPRAARACARPRVRATPPSTARARRPEEVRPQRAAGQEACVAAAAAARPGRLLFVAADCWWRWWVAARLPPKRPAPRRRAQARCSSSSSASCGAPCPSPSGLPRSSS